jgi:hypothetical protein
MSEIVTRQLDAITILDLPKSLLDMPRGSKDRGTLNRVVEEFKSRIAQRCHRLRSLTRASSQRHRR